MIALTNRQTGCSLILFHLFQLTKILAQSLVNRCVFNLVRDVLCQPNFHHRKQYPYMYYRCFIKIKTIGMPLLLYIEKRDVTLNY